MLKRINLIIILFSIILYNNLALADNKILFIDLDYIYYNSKAGKQINNDIKEKKDLEKIILCDVQIEIYPELEKSFLNLLHNSGYPNVKLEKKIDFEKLYNQRLN